MNCQYAAWIQRPCPKRRRYRENTEKKKKHFLCCLSLNFCQASLKKYKLGLGVLNPAVVHYKVTHWPISKKHRKSTKNMSIQRWPLVLCLHAKRFNGRGKLKTKVSFPCANLDLSSIESVISETAPANQAAPVYQLIGVSNHMGSLHSGHYTADCLSPVSGEWMHYDDSRVTPTSVDELSTSTAYILFYARSDLSCYGS